MTAANALQYYGQLNEAQLRNMRLVVDPACHARPPGSAKASDYGWSLNRMREFLSAHSALGKGDVNVESIRYLTYPAQATGYMVGKECFCDLYLRVCQKLNRPVVQDLPAARAFFDLVLRNGEIPLSVLRETVATVYEL